jgi:hypothetical protein
MAAAAAPPSEDHCQAKEREEVACFHDRVSLGSVEVKRAVEAFNKL